MKTLEISKERQLLTREKFLRLKPFLLDEIENQLGQTVKLYEHPTNGDSSPVMVMIEGVVATTDFYDCEDFYEDSEYNPVLHNGQIVCYYEYVENERVFNG